MSTLFSRFGYVVLPPLTGALEEDVRALLLANGKPKTFTHVSEVAEVRRSLASRFGLDVEACTAAGLLHDISADKLAWDREGVPPFYDSVSAALDRGLAAACLDYMTYMEISGELLCPHTNWTLARDLLRNG